jgi:hypothetical protein
MTGHLKPVVASVIAALCFAWATPALAGPYTDDLSKCIVRTVTPEEMTVFVEWMFAMMALHPDVKKLATVSDETRSQLNRKVGALIVHTLTESCLAEARDAVKFEGNEAITHGFQVFGQVAGRALFTDPNVAKGVADLEKSVDEKKLKEKLGMSR